MAVRFKLDQGNMLARALILFSALKYGILLCVVATIAAMFVSEWFGGPVMLYALLIGMAFNFLTEDGRFRRGIDFSADFILKVGVALLGLKITLGEISALGWPMMLLVLSCLGSTLIAGWAIGRAIGLRSDHAVLSAGAVAICGASAALAIAAVLPQHKKSEQNTIMTVIGATVLSTLALVIYPLVAKQLGLSDIEVGAFMGATIHNVAQAVGAGYSVSDVSGDTSAIVKLTRVTLLAPVVFVVALIFRSKSGEGDNRKKVSLIPKFLIVFFGCVILNSIAVFPPVLVEVGTELSRWFLIIAIAALGCKTSLRDLVSVGFRPILALSVQTLFLAAFALTALMLWI